MKGPSVGPRRALLQLVKTKPNRELIEVLETLLDGARRGEVTGLAFASTFGKGRYIVDWVGSCEDQPTHTLGMLTTLCDELSDMVRERDAGDER